jgi:prenyltransferase beta subunit
MYVKKNDALKFALYLLFTMIFLSNIIQASQKSPEIILPTSTNDITPQIANTSNRDLINAVLDVYDANYESLGYYPEHHITNLLSTFNALFILKAINRLSIVDTEAVMNFTLSFRDELSPAFIDPYSMRYLDTNFQLSYYPRYSVLETTCYAVGNLALLDELEVIDVPSIMEYIWSCYKATDGAFIGQPYSISLDPRFLIPTLENTYFAVQALTLLGEDWDLKAIEKAAIVQFINSLQIHGSNGGFCNDPDPTFESLGDISYEVSLLSSYYALTLLEIFSMAETINMMDFHSFLTGLYQPEEHYFKISPYPTPLTQCNLIATAIAVELSDLTSFSDYDRNACVQYLFDHRNSNGAWDASSNEAYHEILSTYEVMRSMDELNLLSTLPTAEKNAIQQFVELFHSGSAYGPLSTKYTALESLGWIVRSFHEFDRIDEISLLAVYMDFLGAYDVIYGPTRTSYGFYSTIDQDPNFRRFRSYPIEYFSSGHHVYNEEIDGLFMSKNVYCALDSMKRMVKLDDFANDHNLTRLINCLIDAQYLANDPYFGGFLPYSVCKDFSIASQQAKIYLEHAYYAIKAMEILASELGYTDINDVGFDDAALAVYIDERMITTPTESYYNPERPVCALTRLENTYQALYVLHATNHMNTINLDKVETYVRNVLNHESLKSVYYCYKIASLLNLSIDFNLSRTLALVNKLHNPVDQVFYEDVAHQKSSHEALGWICEMADEDHVRVLVEHSAQAILGSNTVIATNLCNLMLTDFGPYAVVKFESEQLGTTSLFKLANNTFQATLFIPALNTNYPTVIGDLVVYDRSVKITSQAVLIPTTYMVFYSPIIMNITGGLQFVVNAHFQFASGSEPLLQGTMRAIIFKDELLFMTSELSRENERDHSKFSGIFIPTEAGNYSIKLCLNDGFRSEPWSVYNASYVLTRDQSDPRVIAREIEFREMVTLWLALIGAPIGVILFILYLEKYPKRFK